MAPKCFIPYLIHLHECVYMYILQDVDNASLVRVNLERKVESLQEEIMFLKKLHEAV